MTIMAFRRAQGYRQIIEVGSGNHRTLNTPKKFQPGERFDFIVVEPKRSSITVARKTVLFGDVCETVSCDAASDAIAVDRDHEVYLVAVEPRFRRRD